MTLEELHELRNKVIENRERLRILNHQYNEMLEEKHSPEKRNNKADEEIIKKSKAYKIMNYLRMGIPLGIGCLFTLGIVPFMVLFLYIFISPFVGATFEVLVLPKIVFGKDYKVLKISKTTPYLKYWFYLRSYLEKTIKYLKFLKQLLLIKQKQMNFIIKYQMLEKNIID